MEKYNEMVANLVKPGAIIKEQLTPEDCHLWHMATGLASEALELMQGIRQNDTENIKEECGDYVFYFTSICQIQGIEILPTDIFYAPTEMAIVSGLLLDQVKKKVIYRKEINSEVINNLLSDCLNMLNGCCEWYGFTIEDAKRHNYDKLIKKRYPNGYSDEAAQERADKK